jgi:hypothetical protein
MTTQPPAGALNLERIVFLAHPREAMEEIVGVPSDIEITITQNNQRILKCPVLNVSGTEFIQNHESILMEHGIRVPDDVIVSIDNDAQGMIHFDVRLDTLYS